MKTKKELVKLSNAIGKAIRTYHKAIFDNLKESGKEFKVISDNDDDDGLRLTIIGILHDNAVDILVDKVRHHKGNETEWLEVHICEEDYHDTDYWCDVDVLGDNADYVYDNINWED